MRETTAYIGLGSNLGDRRELIAQALSRIIRAGATLLGIEHETGENGEHAL